MNKQLNAIQQPKKIYLDDLKGIEKQKDTAQLLFEVEDTGIGMSKETIDRVNAKQYYTTAGTSMEKGSGFGLMLCSDLINRHDGSLTIESVPGKGSRFIIKLPVTKA